MLPLLALAFEDNIFAAGSSYDELILNPNWHVLRKQGKITIPYKEGLPNRPIMRDVYRDGAVYKVHDEKGLPYHKAHIHIKRVGMEAGFVGEFCKGFEDAHFCAATVSRYLAIQRHSVFMLYVVWP
jgi:hypothetical protein